MIKRDEIDILKIDEEIRKNFSVEFSSIDKYKEKLDELNKSIENIIMLKKHLNRNIEENRKKLEEYINQLETREQYNFYLMDTLDLIEKYKIILKTPKKVSFMGRDLDKDDEKNEIIDNFLKIASKYVLLNIESSDYENSISCLNCKKKKFDIIDNNTYICTNCYTRQTIIKHNSCYNDIDRVNLSNKYTYDPKIHFRDCMKQYQGKQNCNIPNKIYDELIEQFERHHLLVGDENTEKSIRFNNITKNHVLIFLKDLNYHKQYENVNLIYYNITGKKINDISHLEEKLMDDFDTLISLYYKLFKNVKRKSFINTQYVLYQLLMNHRHPCRVDDFAILKTTDRKFFHDEVCKVLFEQCGWNHYSYY